MAAEKLTYTQICNLIQQGREDEIPSGYNIVWTTPKPQKLFDIELPSERIIVNGNDFPCPRKAYVSGEYEVIIPLYIIEDEFLDFGTVCLHTKFSLSKLKFEYERRYDIMNWMNNKYPDKPLMFLKAFHEFQNRQFFHYQERLFYLHFWLMQFFEQR